MVPPFTPLLALPLTPVLIQIGGHVTEGAGDTADSNEGTDITSNGVEESCVEGNRLEESTGTAEVPVTEADQAAGGGNSMVSIALAAEHAIAIAINHHPRIPLTLLLALNQTVNLFLWESGFMNRAFRLLAYPYPIS